MSLPEASVERGESLTTELTITNEESHAVVLRDLAASLPEGWRITGLPKGSLAIPPNQSRRVRVTLNIPATTAGGVYPIPLTAKGRDGRQSHITWRVEVPKTADETAGRIEVSKARLTNPKDHYAVGDVLQFAYTVTSLTAAKTTVVPTGSLRGLDPAIDSRATVGTRTSEPGPVTAARLPTT